MWVRFYISDLHVELHQHDSEVSEGEDGVEEELSKRPELLKPKDAERVAEWQSAEGRRLELSGDPNMQERCVRRR